jgi:hypothetical protein
MTEGTGATPVPEPRLPTLREEFLVVAFASTAAMVCFSVDVWNYYEMLKTRGVGQHPPMFSFLGMLFIAFGNAAWISLDRKRRGKAVGGWRFAAIFLGPIAICVYIIVEYRDRAIFLLPAVVAVYGVTICFPGIAVFLLRRAWL